MRDKLAQIAADAAVRAAVVIGVVMFVMAVCNSYDTCDFLSCMPAESNR